MPTRTARSRRMARRSVLLTTATIGVVGVTGCHREADRTTPGPEASSTPASTAPDPDPALLDAIRARMLRVAGRVETTIRNQPKLAPGLAGLSAAHAAHLTELDAARATDSSTPRVPARPDRALVSVLTAEQALYEALVTAARDARSGTFARMLAVMAASIAQHLEALGSPTSSRTEPETS